MPLQNLGLRVAAVVFGLMATAQLARLLIRPAVFIGGHELPLWPSALAAALLVGLCAWMWSLTRAPTA